MHNPTSKVPEGRQLNWTVRHEPPALHWRESAQYAVQVPVGATPPSGREW
jgi:hypothetical protein